MQKLKHNRYILHLAPMEGVGDKAFRKAIATIGGFDEAVRAFLRVPKNGHVESLAQAYDAKEIAPFIFVPQIMGSDPNLMAAMAVELEKRGAPRIDLNCGCPSHTVNRREAGAWLLRDPQRLFDVCSSLVKAVFVPVSVKMRSGYEDIALFSENLLAIEESGVKFVTLHPRTRNEGYEVKADWTLIRKAKETIKIPVIGNGDIFCAEDALRMLIETGCDGLMIGRGALINPFIFQEIRGSLDKRDFTSYLKNYLIQIPICMPPRKKMDKLKQMLGFLFLRTPELLQKRDVILKSACSTLDSLLKEALFYLEELK